MREGAHVLNRAPEVMGAIVSLSREQSELAAHTRLVSGEPWSERQDLNFRRLASSGRSLICRIEPEAFPETVLNPEGQASALSATASRNAGTRKTAVASSKAS